MGTIRAFTGFEEPRDCDGELCVQTFKATSDSTEFRSGKFYNFDAESGVLFLNVVQMPSKSLGKSSWDRTRPLDRFSHDGLTITEYSIDYHIVIEADCTVKAGTDFCPLDDVTNNVRTLNMQNYIKKLASMG